METLFSISSLLVMPFWFLLIFLPHWRWTKRIVGSPLITAPASLLYLILVIPVVGQVFPAVGNPTLAGIVTLLGEPTGATIAWVHFLAFDLFVARWAYVDNWETGISAWLMAPILFFTLMLGPVGFLLYLGAKTIKQRGKVQTAVSSLQSS